MSKVRGVLVITGDVQDAGYRIAVIRTCQKLGLVGYIENIPDGTVKVVCEGEKEQIEKMIPLIKIKTETIEVENVSITYHAPTGEFDGMGFVVKVEESFKGLIQEMFQGYATAGKYFTVMFKKQDATVAEIKNVGEKIDKFRGETTLKFDNLDDKYHIISQSLISMNKMAEARERQLMKTIVLMDKRAEMRDKQLIRTVDRFTAIVDNFLKSKKVSIKRKKRSKK
ncbi:MAG: acylphosphatase [Candidatus Thermoplasmatota archaeon]